MPQRKNSRADLGNSKRASDTYDNNNIFLTDQGWVYRHFKGNPDNADVRYWDEILVAGQVNPEDRSAMGDFFEDSADYQPTIYLDAAGNEVDRENSTPFYPLATGNQKYPHPAPLGAYEPDGSEPGNPDGFFDLQYSKHSEAVTTLDGFGNEVTTIEEFGDPANYDVDALTNAEGMVKPPGTEDLGYEQFPEVDPENPAAPPATP